MSSQRIIVFAFALLVTVNSLSVENSKSSPPHILYMLADDLGWIDVGFHGSKIHTPNIDTLAKDGVILDNFYVQPVLYTSQGALMTGRYPIHTGLQHEVVHPTKSIWITIRCQTLPGQLKKVGKPSHRLPKLRYLFPYAPIHNSLHNIISYYEDHRFSVIVIPPGYATHLVGKWHLGFYKWPYVPTKRGFDTAYGFWDGAEGHFDHKRDGVVDFRNGTEPVTNLDGKYATNEYVQVARYDSQKPIPIDGFDVWNTISRGDASPRTEILLNIDNQPNGTKGFGHNYQGMALRMGSMKLLMNVKNITWFKPPELGGIPPEVQYTNGWLADETDEEVLEQLRMYDM
ncbi:hypothetical protein OS493_039039, partial [Desmophyllum pertusum]